MPKAIRESVFIVSIAAVLLVVGAGGFFVGNMPPVDFTPHTKVVIPAGSSAQSAAQLLVDANVVRSRDIFLFLLILGGNTASIQSGEYVFDTPHTTLSVIQQVTDGVYGAGRVRITIPEGVSNTQIADIFDEKLSDSFDREEFLVLSQSYQGYLFPSTYAFFASATASDVLERLHSEFNRQFSEELKTHNEATFHNMIVLASLLEREATSVADAQIISGIIRNRLRIDMPLQIDATLAYLLGKESSELTRTDLAMDSPLNTYRNKGLPPTPIGNPGEQMVWAALNPKSSEYLYYLHDTDGRAHYARTYVEHLANKKKYLD